MTPTPHPRLTVAHGSALDTILNDPDAVTALADVLRELAADAARDAAAFTGQPHDHGRVGSASAYARVLGTNMRERAEQLLDEHRQRAAENATSDCTLAADCTAAGHLFECWSLDGTPFDAQRIALREARPVA